LTHVATPAPRVFMPAQQHRPGRTRTRSTLTRATARAAKEASASRWSPPRCRCACPGDIVAAAAATSPHQAKGRPARLVRQWTGVRQRTRVPSAAASMRHKALSTARSARSLRHTAQIAYSSMSRPRVRSSRTVDRQARRAITSRAAISARCSASLERKCTTLPARSARAHASPVS
jgi:hypothetical protein